MTIASADTFEQAVSDVLSRHRLPAAFRRTAEQHYVPLALQLRNMRATDGQLTVGISGAQGSGKSTLADFLRVAAGTTFGWKVAVLSLDDFYLTLAEREALADEVHPLLATRGVPGTHDTDMLCSCLEELRQLGKGERMALPRFDKSVDDRAPQSRWPVVEGPIDLVVLEGWCIGAEAQAAEDLVEPVNALERNEDPDGTWRRYVNDALRDKYEPIFASLDALIFFAVPGFDAILRWRLEQEEKLAVKSPQAPGLMNREQIARFIQFFERLTRLALTELPGKADFVLRLDDTHAVIG